MYVERRYYIGSANKEFPRQIADILEEFQVAYDLRDDPFGSTLVFYVSETHERWAELEPLLPKAHTEEGSYIVLVKHSANYTEEERLSADWLLIYCGYEGVHPQNREAVIAGTCTYLLERKAPLLPKVVAKHYTQAGLYAISKLPKWGTNRFFCGCSDGIVTDLFCRDLAKKTLDESGLAGIRFAPVLKNKTTDPVPDVHQMVFDHVIPAEAIVPIYGYTVGECEICHKQILENRGHGPFLFGVKAEMMDRSIDFFATDPIFDAWPYKIVSQRVYRLFREKKIDRNVGFIPIPSK